MSLRQEPIAPTKIVVDLHTHSLYIQTTRKLFTELTFDFPQLNSRLRSYSQNDAKKLANEIRRRNVFARHSWENSFYVKRASELAERTVIEVYRLGPPDEILNESQKVTAILEKVAILSSILVFKRRKYQKMIGIKQRLEADFNLTIGKEFRFLRSKLEPMSKGKGILIDKKFINRFRKCGFEDLTSFCLSKNKISRRVNSTINWLIESREDPHLSAAIVKTAIALESLLIFNKLEPLSKSLSERAAFLLSPDSNARKNISKIIKRFYNERSKVVHGSSTSVSINLIESVDRLIVLLCLVIANNRVQFRNQEKIQNWCEDIKWGQRTFDIVIPFSKIYLKNALKLYDKIK